MTNYEKAKFLAENCNMIRFEGNKSVWMNTLYGNYRFKNVSKRQADKLKEIVTTNKIRGRVI